MNEVNKLKHGSNNDFVRFRLPYGIKQRFFDKGYNLSEFLRNAIYFALANESNYEKIMFPKLEL